MKTEWVKDLQSFRSLSTVWNALLRASTVDSVFLTHEWLLSWWESFGEEDSLHVLVARDAGDEPAAFFPGRKRKEVLLFLASDEVSDYCDCICRAGLEEGFYESLMDSALYRQTGIQRSLWQGIRENSPTLSMVPTSAARGGINVDIEPVEVAPVLALPRSYDRFLESLSRKKRHEIRRKMRRMEESGGCRVRILSRPEEVRTGLRDFIDMHRESGPEKQQFWRKKGMADFFGSMTDRLSMKGWLELYALRKEGRLLALLLAFCYGRETCLYNIAYDRDYAHLHPGLYLFDQSIRHSIGQKRARVDFLRGDERYKYDFGARDRKIYELRSNLGKTE